MVHKVILHRIDPGMDSGTIVEWAKREGDYVAKGERIASIETLKAIVDIEAPESGVLIKILHPVGSAVPINDVIAIIGAPDEVITEIEVRESQVSKESEKPEAERVSVSPVARKLAAEYGVDLTKIKGTGPEGRIIREDILDTVKRADSDKAPLPQVSPDIVEETISLTSTRKTTAERMAQSHSTIPQAILMMKADMSEVRKELQQATERPSYTAVFVKAVAQALRENRIMNSKLEGNEIKILKDVNVGVAVATERGLIVPVVHNAPEKSLREVSDIIRGLVEKAQQGKLSLSEVLGGTFTVTNLGMFGVDIFIPIINPTEAGILGVGTIKDEPQAVNGRVEVKPTVTLTLSFDHRIVDGAPAAKFLAKVKEFIENPSQLFSWQ